MSEVNNLKAACKMVCNMLERDDTDIRAEAARELRRSVGDAIASIESPKPASDWVSVDSNNFPDSQCVNVWVYCEGGHIAKTLYQECAFNYLKDSLYTRKQCGKNSRYFEISHLYGYKVTHFMPFILPTQPQKDID